MKVSILQYEANPVCESVTMKTGNHQDPWLSHFPGLDQSQETYYNLTFEIILRKILYQWIYV